MATDAGGGCTPYRRVGRRRGQTPREGVSVELRCADSNCTRTSRGGNRSVKCLWPRVRREEAANPVRRTALTAFGLRLLALSRLICGPLLGCCFLLVPGLPLGVRHRVDDLACILVAHLHPRSSAAARYHFDRQLRQNPARFMRSMFCTRMQVAWIAGVFRELAHHRHADESLGEGRCVGPSVCAVATSGPRSGTSEGDVARQHESEGAPGWDGGARTNGPQAIGKSRGGWSTKIHRIASDDRSAIGFSLSGGEAGDGPQGRALPKSMNLFPTRTHRPPRREFGMALRRRVCE